MKMKELKVRITFFEESLGTANNDPSIHEKFIASKAPDPKSIKEEVEALGVDAVVNESMTVFPKDENGNPFVYDYQWKGYLKDAAKALKKVSDTESSKKEFRAYKQIIDKLIFPQPRKIPINVKGEIGSCQRPLRASTPQGEIVALANSESVPAGSTEEFSILLLDDKHEEWVRELLDYGKLGGTGQWRNSGKGRFTVEYLDD